MAQQPLYRLKSSTAIEPLVNKWMAWSHVLAPVVSSLHLRNYQTDLLRSFIDNPQLHVDACKIPRLRSGHVMDIPAERVHEVKELLLNTEAEQADNLRFAESAIAFHNQLANETEGYSLEPYYAKLPSELRGYVELLYDYYDHPIMRFFEGMLYRSRYYKKHLQSFRLVKQYDDHRPFFMNTPRLPQLGEFHWNVAFDSPQVDQLFKLDNTPQPLGFIRELLDLPAAAEKSLLPLLTTTPRPEYETPKDTTPRIRYLGHACVLIEWQGVSILTDPSIGVLPENASAERFTYEDLPERLDYVLITHAHQDHFCLESLLRLRHKIGCLVVPRANGIFYGDLSLALLARAIGFKNVIEVDAIESIDMPHGEIVAIPFLGEHADLPYAKTGYVVCMDRNRVLFAADSDCLDEEIYQHVRRLLGPIQTVFLGMECVGAPLSWSSGSLLPRQPKHSVDQSRRYKGCDSNRGSVLLEAVGAERLYVYAMGLEPWLEFLLGLAYTPDATQIKEAHRFVRLAREAGFVEARLLSGKQELYLDSVPHERSVSFSTSAV
jgi:L-ascorbate metabolism protein UlaG (beta-lactamase superfamily)